MFRRSFFKFFALPLVPLSIKKYNTVYICEKDGTKKYYLESREKNDNIVHLLHRENGPAIEYSNGTKIWYKNGLLHRDDGPACEFDYGRKEWYKDGILHCIE